MSKTSSVQKLECLKDWLEFMNKTKRRSNPAPATKESTTYNTSRIQYRDRN